MSPDAYLRRVIDDLSDAHRWAFLRVKSNKVGSAYLVLDSNHHVRVVRYHGVTTVAPLITEFQPRTPSALPTGAEIFMAKRPSEAQERRAA